MTLNIVAFTARLSKQCGEFDHKRRVAHRRLADEHRVRPGAARPPAIFGRLLLPLLTKERLGLFEQLGHLVLDDGPDDAGVHVSVAVDYPVAEAHDLTRRPG